jgi:hypothetical protein
LGDLFALGSFLKITEVDKILGLLFKWLKSCINFRKKGLGDILGDFFTNTSGHPDWAQKQLLRRMFVICYFSPETQSNNEVVNGYIAMLKISNPRSSNPLAVVMTIEPCHHNGLKSILKVPRRAL